MTSTTVPATINVRPGGLIALLVAAVSLTAVVTWFLTDLALDTSDDGQSAAPVAVTAAPQDLQAAWGDLYADRTVAVSAAQAGAATLAAGVTPEQLRDAWTGLTAASTGIANGTAVGHPWAGIAGAGALVAQPLEVAYVGFVVGSTGIAD